MKSQNVAQRFWEVHTSQVFALWPLHIWIGVSFTFPCGPPAFFLVHGSSPHSPLPVFSSDASSSYSSSSDFRGRCVGLGAAIHPHHCREKVKRNMSGSGRRHRWFVVIFKSAMVHFLTWTLSYSHNYAYSQLYQHRLFVFPTEQLLLVSGKFLIKGTLISF